MIPGAWLCERIGDDAMGRLMNRLITIRIYLDSDSKNLFLPSHRVMLERETSSQSAQR